MRIIVDAYNLLHQIGKQELINEHERKHFINLLAAYAKKKKHEIIAVFDGGPYPFPSTSRQKGIVVKFSGPKDTADDIIIQYIAEHKGYSMLLVSSDRELCQAAQHYDVTSLVPVDFYQLLTEDEYVVVQKTKTRNTAIKMGDASAEIDRLMQSVEVHKKVDDMEPVADRSSPARKKSKKERKRMHTLKKL